ncbi:MAG: integrase core domain-containing protein [Verrucomicrobiales bacterium]
MGAAAEYNTLPELNALLEEWIERYNTWRPHTANDGQTPWQACSAESRQNWRRDELGLEGGDEA